MILFNRKVLNIDKVFYDMLIFDKIKSYAEHELLAGDIELFLYRFPKLFLLVHILFLF